MSKFTKLITEFITCEVHHKNNVNCFAKLADGNWVAVKKDGTLDWVEVSPSDFESMLETIESVGATVRFTNHSAA